MMRRFDRLLLRRFRSMWSMTCPVGAVPIKSLCMLTESRWTLCEDIAYPCTVDHLYFWTSASSSASMSTSPMNDPFFLYNFNELVCPSALLTQHWGFRGIFWERITLYSLKHFSSHRTFQWTQVLIKWKCRIVWKSTCAFPRRRVHAFTRTPAEHEPADWTPLDRFPCVHLCTHLQQVWGVTRAWPPANFVVSTWITRVSAWISGEFEIACDLAFCAMLIYEIHLLIIKTRRIFWSKHTNCNNFIKQTCCVFVFKRIISIV